MTVLAVHRCRFVDFTPSAVTALAFPPAQPGEKREPRRFGTLAVGHANGNIDLCEWTGQENSAQSTQAWVIRKTLVGLYPSKVDSLVFTLRSVDQPPSSPTLDNLRLFSSGGGSDLVEWDISNSCIRRTLPSQGGTIWSLSANASSSFLALGCEDGSVRLVNIRDDVFVLYKKFDRLKCRILSIAWGPSSLSKPQKSQEMDSGSDEEDSNDPVWTESWIVTGGSDSSIRKWDVSTGRVVDRMNVDKIRGERTLVWAVATLGDGTIISGDSLGIVKFWDSRTCTQLHSFKAHGADVLTMTIGPDGTSVYSAGVDQKVTQFSLAKHSRAGGRASTRWVQSTSRRLHSHDIRALAMWPTYTCTTTNRKGASPSEVSPVLASGGLDMSVVLTPAAMPGDTVVKIVNPLATSSDATFEDSYHRRLPYSVGSSGVSRLYLARKARLIASTRDSGLTLWRIPPKSKASPDETEAEVNDHAKESRSGWTRVLEMDLKVQSNTVASAISDDGQWLSISDLFETKLFRLTYNDDGEAAVERVKNFSSLLEKQPMSHSEISTGSRAITFSVDSSRIILSSAFSSRIVVIDVAREQPRILRTFSQHRRRRGGLDGRAIVNSDSALPDGDANMAEASVEGEKSGPAVHSHVHRLAVSPDGQWLASSDDHAQTHIYNLDSLQHHCTLPTFRLPAQAMAFEPAHASNLILAFPDNTLQIYDVEARNFPVWSKELCTNLPKPLTSAHDTILGITFDPTFGDPSSQNRFVLLWGSTWMCKLGLVPKGPGDGSRRKRQRNDHEPESDQKRGAEYKMVRHYRPILLADFVDGDELVIVERPLGEVLKGLPPPYFSEKYGKT